nr:cation transporter [Clostridia bacterium]
MPTLLARLFIKDHTDYSLPRVRSAYGVLCGALGIFFNIVLFALKLAAGLLSGSISVIADAINNLSDASSSLILIFGFKLASQEPDADHPFGHRRIEYVSGLIVSVIVISMGLELLKTSVEKILNPSLPSYDIVTVIILAASILVKLYMYVYNRAISKKIASEAMNTTAFDSLCDSIATFAVLVSMIPAHFGFAADGWCGILVSAFIIFSGIRSVAETVSPLLGQSADAALVKKIESLVRECECVSGI